MAQPCAVVAYMTYLGLGLVRALGREGIRVLALDPQPDAVGMNSRYATPVVTPDIKADPQAYLDFLLDLGRSLPAKAVLFPTGDPTVVLFSKARDELARYYHYLMPHHDTVLELLTKDGLDNAAARTDTPAPRTVAPAGRADVEAAADALTFPLILKPVESHDWKAPAVAELIGYGTKIVHCRDRGELLAHYDRIAAVNPRLIVQEFVPGDDRNLVYACFYIGRDGEPLGLFQGRKCRVLPPGSGSASYVESMQDPRLTEACLKLLGGVGYRGLGGLELKRDPRDDTYKLIEFNVRYGLWDALGAQCGVNLALMAYRDALGLPVEPRLVHRAGVKWVSFQRDLSAFKLYRRERGMSTAAWLRSLWGEKMWAVFAWDDLAPFLSTAPGYVWDRLAPRLGLARRNGKP